MMNCRTKNYLFLSLSIFAISLSYSSASFSVELADANASAEAATEAADKAAQDGSADPMDKIAKNTYAVLKVLNAYVIAWLNPDKSDATATLQYDFSNYATNLIANQATQLSQQDALSKEVINFPDLENPPPDLDANSIMYPALLPPLDPNEQDQAKKDAAAKQAFTYGKYAGALNIFHLPLSTPEGSIMDQYNYMDFINSTSSIQTFNAYILSGEVANALNGYKITAAQRKLEDQASDDKWFEHVATENSIGIISRQMLMFTSQLYLLTLQLVETQNKLLAATTMTNSLLILSNRADEKKLYGIAMGTIKEP